MLPTIELQISELCQTAFNFRTASIDVVGHTYVYDLDAIREAGRQAGLNLDRFLTLRIARILGKRGPRCDALIYYTPLQDRCALTVCSRRRLALGEPAGPGSGLPGLCDYGRNYLYPAAAPFILYRDGEIHRVYLDEELQPRRRYPCDFSNLFGLTVSEASKADCRRINSDPDQYFDYSVVPEETPELITEDGMELRIHHALCCLMP